MPKTNKKKFQKRVENFICEKCGYQVMGDGYTNHCPICLWSKHVDFNPGDRESDCLGLMDPISIELEKGEYIIVHRCLNCGHKKRNKISKNDNFDLIVDISSRIRR